MDKQTQEVVAIAFKALIEGKDAEAQRIITTSLEDDELTEVVSIARKLEGMITKIMQQRSGT